MIKDNIIPTKGLLFESIYPALSGLPLVPLSSTDKPLHAGHQGRGTSSRSRGPWPRDLSREVS